MRFGQARTFLSALSVALACDAASPELDDFEFDDGAFSTPRDGEAASTVRLVTANLEGWDWANRLEANGMAPDAKIAFGWMQVLFLDSLVGPGSTIFNIQESSVRRPQTGHMDWPKVMTWGLGSEHALLPEAFEAWYQRISPDYGNPHNDNDTWGNAIATDLPLADYQEWNLNEGCGGPVQRAAQVARVNVEGVNIWSVNVHLEFCRPGGIQLSFNSCQLDQLFSRLETLPEQDVVVVSGDFNVDENPRGPTAACPDDVHPEHFHAMVRDFADRDFIRVESASVDHAFVRDADFQLCGMRSSSFEPTYTTPDREYEMTDHDIIQLDLDVGGAGISPTMMPLLVAID